MEEKSHQCLEDCSLHFNPQSNMHFTNSSIQTSSGLFGQAAMGLAPRTSPPDQAKNSVFSNALSSPARWSLQPYHLSQGGGYYPNGTLPTGSGWNHEVNSSNQNRDSHSPDSNDSSMDMHLDSPAHESY